mmetsp:Transcript_57856/g.164377  ORF Transcript_57856/g.164377 Transcript_57856/m.164377 type:complete len:335 (+) Transcript_57856:148-1152(+)
MLVCGKSWCSPALSNGTLRAVDGEQVHAVGADADRGDRHARELLDAQDVTLRCCRQVGEPLAPGDVLLPALQRLVLADHLLQVVEVRREVAGREAHLCHICIAVGDRNADLLETRQHVQFRYADAVETVHHGRVLHQGDVKPSTTSPAPGRSAVLMTNFLQHLPNLHVGAGLQLERPSGVALPCFDHVDADVFLDEVFELLALVLQLGGERPIANARGVGLHDAHHVVDDLRRHAEARADAADRRVGGRDEGVRAEVDVQERCICALHKDLAAASNLLMDERNRVHDLVPQHLCILTIAPDLLLDVADATLGAPVRVEGLPRVVLTQALPQQQL